MEKRVRVVMVFVLSILLAVSGFQLYKIYKDRKESDETFEALASQIIEETNRPKETNVPKGTNIPKGTNSPKEQSIIKKEQALNGKYREIVKKNEDLVGWIRIDGTPINYPVMQTKDRPEYYLDRDFYGKYNKHGVPFVDEKCDVERPSDNLTIYGHHMKDGTMFSVLDKYKEREFYEDHSIIHFDTISSYHDYQVIAVFKTVVDSEVGFPYYEFRDASNEEEFNKYVSEVKSRSLYGNEIPVEYGDKLITMSTCEYSRKNGRIVVVAKQLKK